jgi:hypothetical protein
MGFSEAFPGFLRRANQPWGDRSRLSNPKRIATTANTTSAATSHKNSIPNRPSSCVLEDEMPATGPWSVGQRIVGTGAGWRQSANSGATAYDLDVAVHDRVSGAWTADFAVRIAA